MSDKTAMPCHICGAEGKHTCISYDDPVTGKRVAHSMPLEIVQSIKETARLEGIRLGLETVIAKLEQDAEEWEKASKHYERGGNDKLADEASANAQVTSAYIRDIRAITPSDVLKNKNP